MNLFAIFDRAHAIYVKLQQDDPSVDVSMSRELDTDEHSGVGRVGLGINLPKRQGLIKPGALASPYQKFIQQPKVIKGNTAAVDKKIRAFTAALSIMGVSLYKEFGQGLAKIFDSGLVSTGADAFRAVLATYPEDINASDDMVIRFNWEPPAKLIYYSQSAGVSLIYNFKAENIRVTGFTDPNLVDQVSIYDSNITDLVRVRNIAIEKGLIAENAGIAVVLSDQIRVLLHEREGVYQETMDDMLDKIMQKLTLLDVLDAIQNVILGDNGEIYLCFDPILEEDEILAITQVVKALYNQTTLIDEPGETSAWWVIEVGQVGDTAVHISNVGMKPGGTMDTMAKPASDVASQIAAEVDVDAVLPGTNESTASLQEYYLYHKLPLTMRSGKKKRRVYWLG